MGVTRAPVAGSGSAPAWTRRVSRPQALFGMLRSFDAGMRSVTVGLERERVQWGFLVLDARIRSGLAPSLPLVAGDRRARSRVERVRRPAAERAEPISRASGGSGRADRRPGAGPRGHSGRRSRRVQ